MDAITLSAIAGVLLSLAFSYIPGLKAKFDALESAAKQAIMGALLVAVALAVFGLACAGWAAALGLAVACTQEGAVEFLKVLIAALVSNQSTYLITRRRQDPAKVRTQIQPIR